MQIADDPDNATLIQTPGGKNTWVVEFNKKIRKYQYSFKNARETWFDKKKIK